LPPIKQQKQTLAIASSAPIATAELFGLSESHIRFEYQNRIFDAYLDQNALPPDQKEKAAVIKAFKKGLWTSSKNKSPHAIVVASKNDNCFFKIRTSYDSRMKSTHAVLDEKHVRVTFNNYDRNAHS
jgi:hypothetical protein